MSVLAQRGGPDRELGEIDCGSERERVEALLGLLNDGAERVSTYRLAALRAFVEERVAVRERASILFPPKELEREAARFNRPAEPVPHRTVALTIAAEQLPALLTGHVHKALSFRNAGEPRTTKGKPTTGPLKGETIDVTLEGPGGELAITERIHCDSISDALNFALALALAKNRPYGEALCRCHAEGCGRFWLVPERLSSKPTRNFCQIHEAEKKRLGSVERKRRQRSKPAQPTIDPAAKPAAKTK